MGRTICTESGRMLLHANEELSRWRQASKRLRLGAVPTSSDGEAELWVCVNEYPGNREPLEVRVNGRRAGRVMPSPDRAGQWHWRCIRPRRGTLRSGDNEIVLSCDNPAMNAWMLGIEPGHRDPGSALSTDGGRTWHREHMGAAGVLRGEYLVRVRLTGPRPAELSPPPIVYELARHPRLREARALVPAKIRDAHDPWTQLLALRTWIARGWTYEAFGNRYAPWDPATVLAWTRGGWGHGRAQPIAMCVHYGMVFTVLAAALGHTSRGIAVTEDINGPNGHFMSEVWDRDLDKWVAHDPNFDLHYERDGRRLSAIELARWDHGIEMRRGPGFTSECPRLNGLLNEKLATGESFALVAVWRRNDVLSDPSAAPPNHGSVVYCETDLVWYSPKPSTPVAPMFPFRTGDERYFDAPPSRRGRGRA